MEARKHGHHHWVSLGSTTLHQEERALVVELLERMMVTEVEVEWGAVIVRMMG